MLGRLHSSSRRWPALLLLIGGLAVAACSSTGSAPDGGDVGAGGGDAGDRAYTTTVPGCAWPSYLTPADFTASHCSQVAHTVLTCNSATGYAACVTSASECDTSNTNITGPFTCENHCSAGEFAIACGDVGPVPAPPPEPPGCRGAFFTPAGVTFYCCPCGS